MDRKKIVHRLDTPYSTIEWPLISPDDQDVILELLCRLLSPLGLHRMSFITPSKGKRKRAHKQNNRENTGSASSVPPVPELAGYVDVGLANISRNLQDMSANKGAAPESEKPGTVGGKSPYCIVFVARSGQSSAFHCHFLQMVALASQAQPPDRTVRLVGLSKPCEDRLSAALGIPRASSIALREDAPQAKGLVDFVREHVRPVEAAWLREARSGQFRETNIEAVQTKVGSKKAGPSQPGNKTE
ncbi:hypothetical protein B0H66DRAFT_363711 [Apodospora peruviana]|uniref:Uncharacterized protein n=1 Tax=Apodospora peruviana TaxID=516989 RepID=A0AAE0HWF6_9PEZI|nr:hypothetical protein B0H66DRAFT_363711 [Apodospora peruviana]